MALVAVVVGPLQMQRSQYAFKRLVMPATILGHTSAAARQLWTCVIGGVGVQPLFQGSPSQPQSLPPRGDFQSFEIQIVDSLRAYKRFDFPDNLVLEVRLEPPFLASSLEAVRSTS